ncbi:MAG: Transcriptional regulator, AraC family protein, partial [Labilithrix sp.]|nr:Transcriptional regulator, AraC family protein [Labilithrix sp.]
DPTLHRYLLPSAERLRDAAPRTDPMIGALEEAVAAALPSGAVSLERAARTVGVGARTLQRRLREHALTFQDVVDRVRRVAAQRLLDNPDLSVKEVAFLLGFSDPRGFRRAQKRWREKDTIVS